MNYLKSPLIVNWSLSVNCNFNCSHCYSRTEKDQELTLAEHRRIVDILVKNQVPYINFGGGEPLLVPHLLDIAAYAEKQGLKVSLTTNGFLVDAQRARSLKEAGVSKVEVSIDSHEPAVHDEFRNRKGSHKKACEAVGHLLEAGITVDISTVICDINHEYFAEIVDMVSDLGARKISVHNYKCSGAGYTNRQKLDLSPEKWRDFYKIAHDLKSRETRVKISLDDPIISSLEGLDQGLAKTRSLVQGSTCGKLSLAVKTNGDMTPCGFMPIVIGNILRDDLADIWVNSDVLSKMRNKIPQGKCEGCKSYDTCLGGCTSRAYAMTGEFSSPDPHCWV